MAYTTDKFSRVSDSDTGRPVIAQLAAGKSIGATSISLNGATNWTTLTKIHFAIYNTIVVSGKTIKDTTTQTEWTGTLAGTTISNLALSGGTDQTYLAGAYVELTPTAKYAKDLYDGLAVLHNPDGSFKAGAVGTTATLADAIVTTAKLADGSVTPAKWTNPYRFSAFASVATTIAAGSAGSFGTFTKVGFQTEVLDPNSNYDNGTNYRYTAPVAGTYMFNTKVELFVQNGVVVQSQMQKNGTTAIATSPQAYNSTGGANSIAVLITKEVVLNAGDYIEVFVHTSQTTTSSTNLNTDITYFEGYLVSQT